MTYDVPLSAVGMNFTLSFVFEETAPEGSDSEKLNLLQSKEYFVDVLIIDITDRIGNATETSTDDAAEGSNSDATTAENKTN